MDTDKLSFRLTEIKEAMEGIDGGLTHLCQAVNAFYEDTPAVEDQPTLRDRFAMAALTGLVASGLEEHWDQTKQQHSGWQADVDRRWASYCYQMADAMLEARQARKEKA